MANYLRAVIGEEKDIIIGLAETTDVVKTAGSIHKSKAWLKSALGRVITATYLMNALSKDDKTSIAVTVKNGRGLRLSAYTSGKTLKGLIDEVNSIVLPYENGYNLQLLFKDGGELKVVKDLGFGKPFTGVSKIISGDIFSDLAYYYTTSEQQPTIFVLDEVFSDSDTISLAGGIMLQVLPGASARSIDQIETRLEVFQNLKNYLALGNLEEVLQVLLGDELVYQIVEEREFFYRCDCTAEKVESALLTIGSEELADIKQHEGTVELMCHYCCKKYNFDKYYIDRLLGQIERGDH